MISLDLEGRSHLDELARITGRSAGAILRLLIGQAEIRPGAQLVDDDARAPSHLLLRPGAHAHRLEELRQAAGCSRSRLVRQLLRQCPTPPAPDLRIRPSITVVRLPDPPRPVRRQKGHRPARHHASLTYVHALLRRPENEDVYQRLGRLAAATGRTIAETLRLLVLQAEVTLPPDIQLEDGPVIVRITRRSDER